MTGLDYELIDFLAEPFPINDHGEQDGFIYLTEVPLIHRLHSADPAWEFEITNTLITPASAGQPACTTVTAKMTIAGVTRSGVGCKFAAVQKYGKDRKPLAAPIVHPIGDKEVKGAATDALKRCARQFGVGGYLLALSGKKVKMPEFARWYKQQFGGEQQSRKSQQPAPRNLAELNGEHAQETIDEIEDRTTPRDERAEQYARAELDNELPTIGKLWPAGSVVSTALFDKNMSELADMGVNVGGIIYPVAIRELGYASDADVKAAVELDSLLGFEGTLEQLMNRVIECAEF